MREITIAELEELKRDGKKILADFKARWCVPCKTLKPKLDIISNEYPNVTFVKVDVDKNMDRCLQLGIRSVPTVIIYDGETVIDRSQGVNHETYYKSILDKL